MGALRVPKSSRGSGTVVDDALHRLQLATHLSDEELPHHGISHPKTIWLHALEIIDRLKESGIKVDELSLERGLALHDALFHIDPKLLGFRTSEELAAHMVYQFCKDHGASEIEARKAERVALATSPLVRPRTPEEIIARASDLWNLTASYEVFAEATRNYYREVMLRRGHEIPFDHWLPGSFDYLRLFLWPMLELTPRAYDAAGRSDWHTKTLGNIVRLWRETFGDSKPVVLEVLDRDSPKPLWRGGSSCLWVGVHPNEEIREILVGRLSAIDPADRISFVVPGDARHLPFPDGSVDEVILYGASIDERIEAARVVRDGGRVLTDNKVQRTKAVDSSRAN